MTPTELEKLCDESIASTVDLGFHAKQANVMLTTPRGWKAPPKFPRGYLLQVKDDGRRIWSYRAERVKAWVRSNMAEFGNAA